MAATGLVRGPGALAQADGPPSFPEELVAAEVLGVSLSTVPALVPSIMLANGFEPDLDAPAPRNPPPDALALHYKRGNAANVRPGESFHYTDTISRNERPGRPAYARSLRQLSYRHAYALPPASAEPGRWEQNPDKDWFVPIFEKVCAYQAEINRRDTCMRSDVQLNTQANGTMALILNAYTTEVRLGRTVEVE